MPITPRLHRTVLALIAVVLGSFLVWGAWTEPAGAERPAAVEPETTRSPTGTQSDFCLPGTTTCAAPWSWVVSHVNAMLRVGADGNGAPSDSGMAIALTAELAIAAACVRTAFLHHRRARWRGPQP